MQSTSILDTNVVIYLITGHPEFSTRAAKVIKLFLNDDNTAFLPVAVIAEVIYVLEGSLFKYSCCETSKALEKFIMNIKIECQDKHAVLYGLRLHGETNLDFVDAYCAGLAIEHQAILITNDTKIPKHSNCPHHII